MSPEDLKTCFELIEEVYAFLSEYPAAKALYMKLYEAMQILEKVEPIVED